MKVFSPEILLEAYRNDVRDFSYSELEEVELERYYLRELTLRKANLKSANLRGINLGDSDLKEVNLDGANLKDASLNRADLRGANLQIANLERAYLEEADLRGADLKGANLRGANLINVDLRNADLRYAILDTATLRGANLTETKIDYQIKPGLLEKVAEAALEEDALDMGYFHLCEATHCIAGWAVHLAEDGKKLEEKYGAEIAGLLLLGQEAHSHFYDGNHYATEYLESILEK